MALKKRRLPLNSSKKDYVDAVLIEELREEEQMWISYEDDEQAVKNQLADGILDQLLADTAQSVMTAMLRKQ